MSCSHSREDAARSLLALSAGASRWQSASLQGARGQVASARGFWISFHELVASYPWTIKRVIRVLDEAPEIPRRNAFAYVVAAFVPYAGRIGAGFGLLLYAYAVGVVAAIAIPAYQNYTIRATLTAAVTDSRPARDALGHYYEANKLIPAGLNAVGISEAGPHGIALGLDQKSMILTVKAPRGTLIFVPSKDGQGHVVWACRGGQDVLPAQLPLSCH